MSSFKLQDHMFNVADRILYSANNGRTGPAVPLLISKNPLRLRNLTHHRFNFRHTSRTRWPPINIEQDFSAAAPCNDILRSPIAA